MRAYVAHVAGRLSARPSLSVRVAQACEGTGVEIMSVVTKKHGVAVGKRQRIRTRVSGTKEREKW